MYGMYWTRGLLLPEWKQNKFIFVYIFCLQFFVYNFSEKLQVLQAIASKNFRQEIIQKLRRQKSKASYIRDKFGLGPGSTNRDHKLDKIGKSKSVALPSPIKEDPLEDLASRYRFTSIKNILNFSQGGHEGQLIRMLRLLGQVETFVKYK